VNLAKGMLKSFALPIQRGSHQFLKVLLHLATAIKTEPIKGFKFSKWQHHLRVDIKTQDGVALQRHLGFMIFELC
jgi:hypothetical protein